MKGNAVSADDAAAVTGGTVVDGRVCGFGFGLGLWLGLGFAPVPWPDPPLDPDAVALAAGVAVATDDGVEQSSAVLCCDRATNNGMQAPVASWFTLRAITTASYAVPLVRPLRIALVLPAAVADVIVSSVDVVGSLSSVGRLTLY